MTERFSKVFFRLLAPGLLMAFALLAAPDARACGPYCDMPGDRGGVAYKMDSAIACESACDRTQGCRGWTWVKPGVQGPQAVCWLKRETVATMQSNCCISGYRGDRTATASVRQFRLEGFELPRPEAVPQPAPDGRNAPAVRGQPDMRPVCNCQDKQGTWYHEALGQCYRDATGLADYKCR